MSKKLAILEYDSIYNMNICIACVNVDIDTLEKKKECRDQIRDIVKSITDDSNVPYSISFKFLDKIEMFELTSFQEINGYYVPKYYEKIEDFISDYSNEAEDIKQKLKADVEEVEEVKPKKKLGFI